MLIVVVVVKKLRFEGAINRCFFVLEQTKVVTPHSVRKIIYFAAVVVAGLIFDTKVVWLKK